MGKRGIGTIGPLAAAGAVAWQSLGLGTAGAQTPGPPPRAPAVRGAGSCSATACHGGIEPGAGRVLRNEHATWVTRDRHADAYRVLTGERSQTIADNLAKPRVAPEKDARCLACHATPVASADPATLPALMSDGVGCESCHGPSGGWAAKHIEWDWARRTPQDKAASGMTPTADLVSRARVCAGCHVGAPARDGLPVKDVNHDLIAAGHPRLNFEFSAYLANMAHHWRDDTGPDAAAGFPARAWAVGQVVTARAALDLLRDRARRAGGDAAPWPEFAEFGCFSCHHDLRDDPWRRQPGTVSTPSGRARWGSWHYPLLTALAEAGPEPEGDALDAALHVLRTATDAPRADPAEVARLAGAASELLGRWEDRLSGRDFDAALVNRLYSRVSDLQKRGEVKSWDEATQRYLALVPLAQALRMLGPGPDRTGELTRLRDSLGYPEGYDSPRAFNPAAAPPAR